MIVKEETYSSRQQLNNCYYSDSNSSLLHLDESQKKLIEKVAQEKPGGVFLWGTSGSGKTLLLAEALKMKISQLKREGKQVRVIISAMTNTEFLMKDLEAKYLPDLAGDDNARFISLPDLARELKCEHDTAHPQLYIEKILSSLSSQHSPSSPHTILLVDEVNPMSKDEKEKDSCTADWSKLTNRDGVDCLISGRDQGRHCSPSTG